MTANHTKSARIFLADDHPAIIDGLKLLLSQDRHTICGEATCRAEVLERLESSAAEVALLDLALCGESGLDLIPYMVERGVPVLVYSMHEDAATLERALACGASGYVTKRETFAVLLEGVRRVLAGERYISARAAANLEADPQPPAATGKAGPLSEREQQILELLAKGESNAEIAAELNVSIRTVETYFSRILNKLSLDGMRALRKYVRNL